MLPDCVYFVFMRANVERTSQHESGHALVYLLNYVSITAWSIKREGNSYGFVETAHGLPDHLALTEQFAGTAASGARLPWRSVYELMPNVFDDRETDVQQSARIVGRSMARAGLRGICDHLEVLDHLLQLILRRVRLLLKNEPFPQAVASLARYMREHEREDGGSINTRMLNQLRIHKIGRVEKEHMQRMLNNERYQDILSSENIRACRAKIVERVNIW